MSKKWKNYATDSKLPYFFMLLRNGTLSVRLLDFLIEIILFTMKNPKYGSLESTPRWLNHTVCTEFKILNNVFLSY